MYLRISLLLLALLTGAFNATAFVVAGPALGYQTTAFGYEGNGEAPQTKDEDYRFSVPLLTYAFDRSFVDFFGTNGVRAAELAFRQFNDLPAASLVSDEVLSNSFPRGSLEINFTASAGSMKDVKTAVLTRLVRYMGLMSAEAHTWVLRNRFISNNGLLTNYVVIQRNYDPITRTPTNMVNGMLLNYTINENSPVSTDVTITPVFPGNNRASTVSSGGALNLSQGQSFSSLSYDDMGGLRFLYATNNYNFETLLPAVTVTSGSTSQGGVTASPWFPVGVSNAPVTVAAGGGVTTALRGGIDKVSFVRVEYDSILGTGFFGVTNTYTDSYVSNSIKFTQTVARSIQRPDFILTVGDLGLNNAGLPDPFSRTTAIFQNYAGINGSSPLINGPGVMRPGVQMNFSYLFPYFVTSGSPPAPLPGSTTPEPPSGGPWAFFDGTTMFSVFPVWQGYSLADIERLVLEARSTIE